MIGRRGRDRDRADARPDPAQESEPGREALLSVADLRVAIPTESGVVEAVRGVSLDVMPGETVAVVGESGSGKTMLALAALGLLPPTARLTGSIRIAGEELAGADNAQWRRVRGAQVAMIFQDPMTALNPMYSVGWQIKEGLRLHGSADGRKADDRVIELLESVGLPQPAEMVKRYPHELSGGMRQRVMIAIAIANKPRLLIADEPTTALDVTVQAQILETLKSLQETIGAALILITHDLGIVAGVADRVMVMYAGKAVEVGSLRSVFGRPRMPYTAGLLASLPSLERRSARLRSIPGSPPSPTRYGPGCAFAPRCSFADDECALSPDLIEVEAAHTAACHHALGPARPTSAAGDSLTTTVKPASEPAMPAAPEAGAQVLAIENLVMDYSTGGGLLASRSSVRAVDDVTLELISGRTLALVGESGCGKSTLAQLVVRLLEPTSGTVVLIGKDVTRLNDKALRESRRDIQVVFQDPYSSLNPQQSVGDIIAEPLLVHGVPARERDAKVRDLLTTMGLDPDAGRRYPGEFSGGQRQRIGIARALALEPEVLVLDEPVSALDVSVQADILNLLGDVQRARGTAYLFISHDLAVVRQVSDEIAVMYLGVVVEHGTADQICERPAHPYLVALLSAVPVPDPELARSKPRITLTGEVPSASRIPSGCRFRTRCWKATARCEQEVPALRQIETGHVVACHHPENIAETPADPDSVDAPEGSAA